MTSPCFSRGNRFGGRSRGFTLVELIISIVLLGILAAVGSSMIVDSLSTARMVNAANASANQARYALERVEREIREIQFSPGGATSPCSGGSGGNYCITTPFAANKLTFIRTIGGAPVTVTIDNSTTPGALTLSYNPGTTNSTLSTNTSVTFAYYDISGNATTSTSAIRFVALTLTVNDPTSGQSISQASRVALRNAG